MTAPDAKHMEAALALLMKMHGATQLGQRTEWIAAALAAAEREGMKRAAEIVKTGGTYPITRDSLAAAILSEAGEDA